MHEKSELVKEIEEKYFLPFIRELEKIDRANLKLILEEALRSLQRTKRTKKFEPDCYIDDYLDNFPDTWFCSL